MAWEARLGLKPCFLLLCLPLIEGLNGLGSPSGIETLRQLLESTADLAG